MAKTTASLQQISPDKIRNNPDNPRLVFREEDMRELMDSIKEVGVRVPISLYEDGSKFVLIDGERRWKCAKRLNLPEIPSIVQPKPSRLENILMMFNIHNVRVDWDPMPMALKLRDIQNLLIKEGKDSSPKALAGVTGVPLPSIRRALELLELPQKYQKMLIAEAAKPRAEQRIKADLFIEIYKSLHVVERYAPEVLEKISKPEYIDSMVKKYVQGVIDNVVGYREVSKIARAERAGVDKREATPALIRLVRDPKYSIKNAYSDTVEAAYERRNLLSRTLGLADWLGTIRSGSRLNLEMREALQRLQSEIERLLGRQQ